MTNEPKAKSTRPKPASNEAALIRVGKDEVNLVEYPFASLSTKPSDNANIVYTWQNRHPVTGRLIEAEWRVEGSRQMGLPNATDECVYLVALELTRAAGMPQEVYFTRYDFLKRLGWATGLKEYKILDTSFQRLTGAVITSKNAFWNPEAKSFVNTGFHIFEQYKILASAPGRKSKLERELPLSYFRWNDVFYDSLTRGYIRSLDLGFVLSLKLPLSKRLFRYLDMKRRDGKGKFEIELHRLCELHLGMTPAPHYSTLKVRLKAAHEELITRGFLETTTYENMKSAGREREEKVCYQFNPNFYKAQSTEEQAPAEQAPLIQATTTRSSTAQLATPTDHLPIAAPTSPLPAVTELPAIAEKPIPIAPETTALIDAMKQLGVDSAVATNLVAQFSTAQITLQLDCLADRKPQKNPAGLFLYCLRGGKEPPVAYLQRIEAVSREEATQAANNRARHKATTAAANARLQRQAQDEALAFYDGLPGSAQAILRQRVRVELGEAGERFKIRPGDPQWIITLAEVLSNAELRAMLAEQPEWSMPESAEEVQPLLMPNLDVYVATLQELVTAGHLDVEKLEQYRERYAPLLDTEAWNLVKARIEATDVNHG